ncbi:MAG: UpxY family transcription antiterminator [Cytophagales bacterium]|nr:UpxY family transcription antiterminator [Cytophagales bacterium]
MQGQLDWYVVHTTPQREKTVANQISNLGMEFFLPTYKTVRQWSDRKKKVELPLFPNYVFVHTSERERHLLFSISNLVQFVSFESKPVKVRDTEIEAVKRILDADDDLEVGMANYFETGSKVRIARGQLAGLEGRVLKQNGKSRLLIRIDELQKAFSINVATNLLEAVG